MGFKKNGRSDQRSQVSFIGDMISSDNQGAAGVSFSAAGDIFHVAVFKSLGHGNDALVVDARKMFIERFIPIFQRYFDFISEGKEKVSIEYESHLHDSSPRELLVSTLDKDRIVKYTTAGIHKDDLKFSIFDYPVKKYGSQGQQKSFVIAIKLAMFEYTKEEKGYKPILLFDDIFDKLDEHRVHQLIKLVSENNFGQVFITDTQRSRIEQVFRMIDIDHSIFNVTDGVLSEPEE